MTQRLIIKTLLACRVQRDSALSGGRGQDWELFCLLHRVSVWEDEIILEWIMVMETQPTQ